MPRVTVQAANETVTVDYNLPAASRGPVSYATVAEARAALGAPADANYVVWNHGSKMLEEVMASLGANDILVLPERAEPYYIDSADGFRAPNVTHVGSVLGYTEPVATRIPIKNTYLGRPARGWFSMVRARRGIMGMGPGAVIKLSPSSFSRPAQPSPPAGVANPPKEQHWNRYNTDGTTSIMYGAQESIIDVDTAGAFFGNFYAEGRSLGGVAFSGIKSAKSAKLVKIKARGFGSGFSGTPNGEAGSFGIGGGTYEVIDCDFDGRDPQGVEIGSSPLMANRCTGGTVVNTAMHHYRVGMPAIWSCSGVHNWTNVEVYEGNEGGVNMEANTGGLTLNWTGGRCEIPSSSYHFILNASDGTSQKLNVKDVTFKGGRDGDGVMTAHAYIYGSVATQVAADIKRTIGTTTYSGKLGTQSGPLRVYGPLK